MGVGVSLYWGWDEPLVRLSPQLVRALSWCEPLVGVRL